MSDEPEYEDVEPRQPECKVLAFGPFARGYKAAYVTPVMSEDEPDEERYIMRVVSVDAFGLGELTWICRPKNAMSIEPISFILEDGEWVVADTLPGYVGTFVDDGDAREMERKVESLCKNLDPYYAKRLIQREAVDGE